MTRRDLHRLAEELLDLMQARGLSLAPAGISSRGGSEHPPPELTTFIYALCDPDSGAIRYVGRANEPEDRLAHHVYECMATRRRTVFLSAKQEWIFGLIRNRKQPVMRILEEVPRSKRREAEAKWIDWARAQGHILTNTALP